MVRPTGSRLANASPYSVPIDHPHVDAWSRRRSTKVGGPCRRPSTNWLLVTLDRCPFPLPIAADVQHEGRLRDDPQMDAVVIEDPLRIMRLARHVGLREFRPEAGGLDQFGRRHVIGMGVEPNTARRSTAGAAGERRRPTSPGLPASPPGCDWEGPGSPANRLPGWPWPRPSPAHGPPACQRASARRWSGRESPPASRRL